MDHDQQIQILIDQAPPDGTTPQIIQAISPVLKALAAQLKNNEYFILQTLAQGWMMTTLSNRAEPGVEKNVIYAFPTLQDVALSPYSLDDPELMALPMPVTHILFQMLAMKTVYSVVFFENPGNVSQGTEVKRSDVQQLVQHQLQQIQDRNAVPPDIA